MIKIGLSPQGQYLWSISECNILSLWDTEKQHKKYKGEKIEFEKKDVWSVLWSDNKNTDSMKDELSFVFLEKNKLNIIKNLEPEEVLACNGYLADFSDLIITAVKLEDLMFKPYDSNFKVEDIVIQTETRNLRDLREHIKAKMPMEDIYKFVEQNPNRKMWELLAKHALFLFDTATAEKAFTHMNDYMGLDFIKRLKSIDDDKLRKAEIAQFFMDYDNAEDIYNNADRKDLSIAMRLKLGQWDKVISLMNQSGVVQEDSMKVAYVQLANQYMDSKDYDKAEEYYKKAGNKKGLINVYFAKEDYE
jgi:WD repeat-containing protein 35